VTDRRILGLSAASLAAKGAAAALLVVFLIFYLKPVAALLITRWDVRNEKELWVVPRPLPTLPAVSSIKGKTFSYFGYQIDSPWADVKQEKALKFMTVLYFSGGQLIAIHDPAQMPDDVQIMEQADGEHGARIKNIFGEDTMRSNYALRSRILNLTPGDLRLSFSWREMASNSTLLMLKPMWSLQSKDGLYSFETNFLRGFQEGDPARDNMVVIDAFDAQDREIELWIGSQRGTAVRPSQADIDGIVWSVRPAATLQTK